MQTYIVPPRSSASAVKHNPDLCLILHPTTCLETNYSAQPRPRSLSVFPCFFNFIFLTQGSFCCVDRGCCLLLCGFYCIYSLCQCTSSHLIHTWEMLVVTVCLLSAATEEETWFIVGCRAKSLLHFCQVMSQFFHLVIFIFLFFVVFFFFCILYMSLFGSVHWGLDSSGNIWWF